MATDKRDRQRANRSVKQQEQAKDQRRQKTFDLARRALIWTVILAVVFGAAWLVWGGSDETSTTTTTVNSLGAAFGL